MWSKRSNFFYSRIGWRISSHMPNLLYLSMTLKYVAILISNPCCFIANVLKICLQTYLLRYHASLRCYYSIHGAFISKLSAYFTTIIKISPRIFNKTMWNRISQESYATLLVVNKKVQGIVSIVTSDKMLKSAFKGGEKFNELWICRKNSSDQLLNFDNFKLNCTNVSHPGRAI